MCLNNQVRQEYLRESSLIIRSPEEDVISTSLNALMEGSDQVKAHVVDFLRYLCQEYFVVTEGEAVLSMEERRVRKRVRGEMKGIAAQILAFMVTLFEEMEELQVPLSPHLSHPILPILVPLGGRVLCWCVWGSGPSSSTPKSSPLSRSSHPPILISYPPILSYLIIILFYHILIESHNYPLISMHVTSL